ncbi:MAG TPA: hypothetical protein VF015_05205 [Acidimicrobiales bacterium]
MDTALVFTWTGPVVGREAKAVELFGESKDFFGKLAADGKCSELEVFFSASAPFNFAMVRGSLMSIFEIIDNDEFRTLADKCFFLLEGWHYHTFVTGEQTEPFVDRFATVGTGLGYI